MKKIFLSLLVVAMLTTATSAITQAQNSAHFRPDSTIGQDAIIFTRVGSNDANLNYGNYQNLLMYTWTWGGKLGTIRSLIKFTELGTIPSNVTILSANLVLHGVSSDPIAGNQGNNYYPGTPLNYPNNLYIERITGYWNENTVTWNTKPNTTTTDQISIPYSTAQWNYDYTVPNSISLVNMVQHMVSNPNDNNGFMIKLQNESTYRSFIFGSSDNSNEKLRPELYVTYCDPNFTYCFNTINNNYTFNAVDTTGTHNWTIYDNSGDSIIASGLTSFNYSFTTIGNYQICHEITYPFDSNSSCQYCINICVDSQQVARTASAKKIEKVSSNVMNGTIPPMDVINSDPIKVYPNPSSDDWNVTLTSENTENIDVIITDCVGKVVYNYKKNLTKGDNSFVIDGSKLPKGTYVLEIRGGTTNFTQKLSKN